MRRTARILLGRSVQRRSITAHVGGDGRRGTLIFGGFHGDEPKSVSLADELLGTLLEEDRDVDRQWVVVPIVNPDGYAARRRRNARGVDINRNFPTANFEVGDRRRRMFGGDRPASEPETRAVIRAVERFAPRHIVTIHSIDGERFCNNYDGPARDLARMLARANGYPVRASIGYPTPGSFGTWAGVERGIATVTLELPSSHATRRCIDDNLPRLLRLIRA